MPDTLHFYGEDGPLGFLSNFSAHPVALDGQLWPTAEHYFQASKFPADRAAMERIRLAPSPFEAARLGRSRSLPLRPDWEAVKDVVMAHVLAAKFAQHPALAAQLRATGDAEQVQDSPMDAYWGCGADGRGRNRLGTLLMALRSRL